MHLSVTCFSLVCNPSEGRICRKHSSYHSFFYRNITTTYKFAIAMSSLISIIEQDANAEICFTEIEILASYVEFSMYNFVALRQFPRSSEEFVS